MSNAVTQCGFELSDIPTMIINGFKNAFLHYKQRVTLLYEALEAMGVKEMAT
jgi:adenosine deaminase